MILTYGWGVIEVSRGIGFTLLSSASVVMLQHMTGILPCQEHRTISSNVIRRANISFRTQLQSGANLHSPNSLLCV